MDAAGASLDGIGMATLARLDTLSRSLAAALDASGWAAPGDSSAEGARSVMDEIYNMTLLRHVGHTKIVGRSKEDNPSHLSKSR